MTTKVVTTSQKHLGPREGLVHSLWPQEQNMDPPLPPLQPCSATLLPATLPPCYLTYNPNSPNLATRVSPLIGPRCRVANWFTASSLDNIKPPPTYKYSPVVRGL